MAPVWGPGRHIFILPLILNNYERDGRRVKSKHSLWVGHMCVRLAMEKIPRPS